MANKKEESVEFEDSTNIHYIVIMRNQNKQEENRDEMILLAASPSNISFTCELYLAQQPI